jgi:translation initiation factor 1
MSNSPFNNPFARLQSQREEFPEGKPVAPVKEKTVSLRAVVRMERKGRGGKEVTVVEQLALTSTQKKEWLTAMKQALGCGGVIEDENIVIQGDQRERVEAFLRKKGVERISMG